MCRFRWQSRRCNLPDNLFSEISEQTLYFEAEFRLLAQLSQPSQRTHTPLRATACFLAQLFPASGAPIRATHVFSAPVVEARSMQALVCGPL
jgi:hypothetical protein